LDAATWLSPDGFAIAIAVLALVISTVGACYSWLVAQRRQTLESTFHIFEQLQEIEAVLARFRVQSIMKAAELAKFDFKAIPPEDRAALSSVASLFGTAGLFVRSGYVDRSLFMSAWGNSVGVNYFRLCAFMDWRKEELGTANSLWREFEAVGKECFAALDSKTVLKLEQETAYRPR
jgi:hypothetical protein